MVNRRDASRRIRTAKRKQRDHGGRHFSIAFLIAIPGNFLLATIGLFSLITLLDETGINSERWTVFGTGFLGGLAIVGTSKMTRLRVLIHELKHAIVVVFTGNSIKDFHVGDETGHVQYQMYADKVHFAPIIALAPYFFPLFSLPVLIVCLALEGTFDAYLALALGITLAADISMAYTDLHPHQTDLGKVSGGFPAALLYLAGAHFLWWMLCLLWIAGGRNGYVFAALTVAELSARYVLRSFR